MKRHRTENVHFSTRLVCRSLGEGASGKQLAGGEEREFVRGETNFQARAAEVQ